MGEPALGAFFVVRTNGWPARIIRWVTRSTVNHAGIYVGDGLIVEARPEGAGTAPVSEYPDAIWSGMLLTRVESADIVRLAQAKIGTPYSWVDCASIGLAKILGWHVPESVRRRLSRRDRLMCSQLVDLVYHEAGIELFRDGRIPGDVSPEDLREVIANTPVSATS